LIKYQELDDDLKSATHALGLCAESGATVDAVAQILDLESDDANGLLMELAERSLTSFDGGRAVLNPLFHNYAGMRARQQPEHAAGMIERHAYYFGFEIGGLYQRACDKYQDALPAIQQIDLELDNVLLAQERALEDGFTNPWLAVDLTDGLITYWRHKRIQTQKVLQWLNAALKLSRSTKLPQQEAALLCAIGAAHFFDEEMDDALASYGQALRLYELIGDNIGLANTMKAIGDVRLFYKEIDAVKPIYREALEIFVRAGDEIGMANTMMSIGAAQFFLKEVDGALYAYTEALKSYKRTGDKLGQANAIRGIGDIQSFRKEMGAALDSYNEALALYKEIGAKLSQANTLMAIGDLRLSRNDRDADLSFYEQALALFKETGETLGQANSLLSLADMTNDADTYEEAIRLYEQIGDRYSIGRDKAFYGLTLISSGDPESGAKLLKEARQDWVATNHYSGVQHINEILADL
jgi:tetratricopeptide (TPR) repeat protein